MNVALPALVIFLLLLPGFIFRSGLKRAERTSLDYSPFGQVVTEAVLWAVFAHFIWLSMSALLGRRLDATVLLRLLSSDPIGQASATQIVGMQFGWVSIYLVTLLSMSYAAPKLARAVISHYRMDRQTARFGNVFRFHLAPWYYLLSGADFRKEDEPDLIVVSAIVEIAGAATLYTGVLDEYFVTAEGQLDRLALQEVMRRPLAEDKDAAKPEGWYDASRFYRIDGDYFILRYAEVITLNVQYIQLTPSGHVT